MPTIRSSRDAPRTAIFRCAAILSSLGAAVSVLSAQAQPAAAAPRPAEQVIKAYIDAVGGQSALDSVKSWEITAHLLNTKHFSPDKTKLELYWKAPEKARMVKKAIGSVENQGFDGQKAWILMQHGHGHNLSTDKADILQIVCNPLRFTRLLVIYPGVTVEGKAKVDDRDVTVLLVNVQWGDRRFSFDNQSHYLVQLEDHFKSGDPPRFTRFRDYRSVDNLRIPYVVEQNWMDQFEGGGIRIDKVNLNAPIRDITFENPR